MNTVIYQSGTQASIDVTERIKTNPELAQTTTYNQEDQSLTQQVDEIIHMIEESTSEDIYHVPELQELTQDRETIAEQHNDTKLS